MKFKIRAMIILIIFGFVLYLPFSVHLASGNIFEGVPMPDLNTGGSGKMSAAVEQYAESLPKPTVPVQIDMNYMRNHMNILKDKGQSPKQQCSSCHASRADFCDRCHNYVGVNPSIDY